METNSESISVTIKLNETEAKAAQNLLTEILDTDLFGKMEIDSFTALEKFVLAVNTEMLNKIKEKSRNDSPHLFWGEVCGNCSHSSNIHATVGDMLCCRESCPCFKFIPTGKPY